jgi:signal-transduction protein with cAMP-binding, CBS, and nucleotidyltransferase domain
MASTATSLAKWLRRDKVSSLRLRDVCRVSPRDPIEQVVRTMVGCRTGFALVMDGVDGQTRLVGIFTERDFVNRVVAAGMDVSLPVERVMTAGPKVVRRSAAVHSAVEMMEAGGYRHLPVVGDDGQPVGVLSVKDVVRYLVEYFPARVYNLPPTPDQTQPAREGA